MQSECQQAVISRAGSKCKNIAQQLNNAEEHTIGKLAGQYFFSKIVTTWNVGANQGHVQDKLQALLPLIAHTKTGHAVQNKARSCQNIMSDLLEKKIDEAAVDRSTCIFV